MFAETLLNLTQRLAKVGGWTTSGDFDKSYWTPETYQIFDYEGSEPPGFEKVIDCVLPPSRQLVLNAMERAMQGEPSDSEMEVLTFKGRHKWLRVVTESERAADGSVLRISGAVLDITEQKLQEHTQRVLSERLFTTFECMTDAFFMLDSQWRLIYINEAADRLSGGKRHLIIGMTLWDAVPHLVSSPLYKGFHEAMQRREPFHIEYFSVAMQNWIELDAYPSPEGLAVFFHSISEKRAMADRIAASEQRLKYVTQATLDAAWDWDLERNEIWWSGRLERLFGWTLSHARQEMITDNHYWLERVHPDDRMRVINNLENLIKSDGMVWDETYRLLRESGDYAHVEQRTTIVRGEDRHAQHIVGGITDVTHRMEMEQRMLESQRLESVGKLTGHVAHDFNNLLTVFSAMPSCCRAIWKRSPSSPSWPAPSARQP